MLLRLVQPFECFFADESDAVRNVDFSQAFAVLERPITDGSDAVGDADAFQTCTALECPVADGSDAVGDADAFQTCTAREYQITDDFNTLGNIIMIRGQATRITKQTFTVFPE